MPSSLYSSIRTTSAALMLGLGLLQVGSALASATSTSGSWRGSAEMGASITTGNSRTSSVDGQLKLKYMTGPWTQYFKLGTLQARQNGNSTANRTIGEFTSHYQIDNRNYVFGTARASHDAFSGYDYQASVSGGLGRILWDTKAGKLAVEAGPGYRRAKVTGGPVESSAIARLHADFRYKVTDSSRFTQTLSIEAGSDNTEMNAETGFSVAVTKTIAMKLAYTVQHNTHVPIGTQKTDTFTSINLVYAFGI